MAVSYTVESLSAEIPAADYAQSFVDTEKFLGFCRECRNYGARWSCPPFDFDPRALWGRFRTLRLFARVLTPEPEADLSTLLEGLKREKALLLDQLLILEKTCPGSMALSAGTCDCCAVCARPEGLPCRVPSRMRYSIEALGGDVSKTAEHCLHRPLRWITDSRPPEYLMLVGGLLTEP